MSEETRREKKRSYNEWKIGNKLTIKAGIDETVNQKKEIKAGIDETVNQLNKQLIARAVQYVTLAEE